jgi:hypothetical protein
MATTEPFSIYILQPKQFNQSSPNQKLQSYKPIPSIPEPNHRSLNHKLQSPHQFNQDSPLSNHHLQISQSHKKTQPKPESSIFLLFN